MKFAHYNQCWQEYKTQILAPEIEELKAKGGGGALAERICNEWSVLPPGIRASLLKKAAEGYAHDGIDRNAAQVIRMGLVEGLEMVKAASDCQGAEDELARMWKFLALPNPKCTLEEAPSPSTPFALAQDAIERLRAGETVDSMQVRERILAGVSKGKARNVLERRWKDAKTPAEYPKAYAAEGRRTQVAQADDREQSMLVWTARLSPPVARGSDKQPSSPAGFTGVTEEEQEFLDKLSARIGGGPQHATGASPAKEGSGGQMEERIGKCLLELAHRAKKSGALDEAAAQTALWRAAVSSLEGLSELYEYAAERKLHTLEVRLRQAAMKLYRMKPMQKVRLGLLRLVRGNSQEKPKE